MNTKKNVTDKLAAMTSATEPTRQERTTPTPGSTNGHFLAQ
jgi:hypothetical protein